VTYTVDDLFKVGERIYNLERYYNAAGLEHKSEAGFLKGTRLLIL
jgi:aldehyde:ferredoxin oxidoreductase